MHLRVTGNGYKLDYRYLGKKSKSNLRRHSNKQFDSIFIKRSECQLCNSYYATYYGVN